MPHTKESRKIWYNKIKQDPVRWARYCETRKKWKKNNIEKVRKSSRVQQQKYRDENRAEYNEWFAAYWREYLKDPINNFSHKCRTTCRAALKVKNKLPKRGWTIEHKIAVRDWYDYLTGIGIDLQNKKNRIMVYQVVNDEINICFKPRLKNNRAKGTDLGEQIEVAEKLNEKYPFICKDLCSFLKGKYNVA